MRIYFDNASTTPLDPEVVKVMSQVLVEDFGNPSSIHYFGRKSKSIIENARKIVAKEINAAVNEIFFTSSASEANNTILKNAVKDLEVRHIISSPTEHPCVINSLNAIADKQLCKVTYLTVDHQGNIDLSQLEQLLASDSTRKMVSIMHGNNEIGTVVQLNKIGALCRQYDTLFHSDAVQTIGKYAVDVQAAKIDFLSATAHKFHGPKGIGFMYISNDHILSPYVHGGAQERNMRAGTENVVGIAGLAEALRIAEKHRSEVLSHIIDLRQKLKQALDAVFEDIKYNGNQDSDYLHHVLSVSFPPTPKADLLVMNLDIAGIAASSASACSAGIEEDSHVLKAIGHPEERKTIRFSFSKYNTEDEVNYLIEKLQTMTPLKK